MNIEGVIGIVVTVLLSVIGLVVNGYRLRIQALENEIKALEDDMKDLRDRYVRRDDLNGHLLSLNNSIDEVKDSMKDLTKLVLAALVTAEKRGV